ncbi:hypothetical protein SKAU_G00052030 [Synaphobranchus kaupii]|uniref:Uncharacterized protein n=1 Tax=Synaphobranchus kaupii TaxID=118154 RepID=A0A9Q1G423_SYNKA|nr:hypothetical protein SKAU_G00052030 [Synaphobranchus kaupii]
MTGEKKKKKRLNRSILLAKKIIIKDGGSPQGIGEPSVYHAVVVIFLEFFAWGLLTTPMLTVNTAARLALSLQERRASADPCSPSAVSVRLPASRPQRFQAGKCGPGEKRQRMCK